MIEQPFSMVLGVPWFYKQPQTEPRLVPVIRPVSAVTGKRKSGPEQGRPRSPAWTAAEDAILRKHYPHMSNEKISEKYLPSRSPLSINYRACRLKIRKTDTYISRTKREHALRYNNLKKGLR